MLRLKSAKLTLSVAVAVAVAALPIRSADAQNNRSAEIASGILQGIAQGLNGGQNQYPYQPPYQQPYQPPYQPYQPPYQPYQPPYQPGYPTYPQPQPLYNPTVIVPQNPTVTWNPATGRWTQQQTTNVYYPSFNSPQRNTVVNGTQQRTTSSTLRADGSRVNTTNQSWVGADGQRHGQYQSTTTQPSGNRNTVKGSYLK